MTEVDQPVGGAPDRLGQDPVPLAPHQAAAVTWPAVDRLFLATMGTCRERGGAELVQRYGGSAATGFLVEFRTRLAAPGGVVSRAGLAAVTRYRDPVECQRILDKQVAYGMIHRRDDGAVLATERGRTFLTELYELHGWVTRRLWVDHPERVHRLVGTLGRLLAAALAEPNGTEASGGAAGGAGEAFGATAPPYEPDGTPPGVLLLNRLGTLRYHRADAHAAAWLAAGHTARSIAELAPGPERLAIELETDRRSAGPYAALDPAQRLGLLADLAALPG
ncbi:hypothetical protein [Plantactinospora sp. CA-290183]|uniref:hypothetical protein n=1 Tax=Plantactinospora sp. CA-290183 TaxID=3240006 RepID=UPI003D929E35